MAIESLIVANFKGISGRTEFPLAPLTLFLGPNSSGKSSCIHALAALCQTVKLGDSSQSIVLDDEYAHVHLGRFIEIVHSKTYGDSIQLGMSFGRVRIDIGPNQGGAHIEGPVSVEYTFKSTKRTQEVFISNALLSIGERQIRIARHGSRFKATDSKSGKSWEVARFNNFSFEFPWAANLKKLETDWFESMLVMRFVQDLVNRCLRDMHYLGPFRQSPLRRYPFRGSAPNEVGAMGEAAVALLASENVSSKKRSHTKQIGQWLEILGLAKGVKVSRVGNSDLFDVNITMTDDVSLPIADMGYGLSQILPVLAQCSFAKPKSTLLFEQPELHLHPGAARKLARVFVEAIKEKDLRIIAETHSPDFFLEVFSLLKERKISLKDVAAYEVKRTNKCSHYKPITITEDDGHFEADHPWAKNLG